MILGAIALVVVIAGIALFVTRDNEPDEQVSTGTTTTTEPQTTATTGETQPSTIATAPARTAADDLAAFFSVADRLDQHLKTAAAGINGAIADNDANVDQATADAVSAAFTAIPEMQDAIPAGLEPELLRAVLLVESDLVSRTHAMRNYQSVSNPVNEVEPCLQNGGEAAARYPADLAALRALADASPPVAIAAPDSREAEELAVRLGWIDLRNSGCAGCGGYVATDLHDITWYDTPTYNPVADRLVDGLVDDVGFWADFAADTGWTIQFAAC